MVGTQVTRTVLDFTPYTDLLPSSNGSLNASAVDCYLTYKHVPSPNMIYDGVTTHTQSPEWTYGPFAIQADSTLPCEAAKLLEVLRDSVQRQLEHSEEVKISLSGGLDSAVTLALLREATSMPIHAYTLEYSDVDGMAGKQTDRECAGQLAEKYDVQHTYIKITPDQFISDLPQMLEAIAQPYSGVLSAWYFNKMAMQGECIWTGDVSDELFGSYYVHREAATHSQELRRWRYEQYLFSPKEKERLYSTKMLKVWDRSNAYKQMLKWLPNDLYIDPRDAILMAEMLSTLADQEMVSTGMLFDGIVKSPYADEDVIKYVVQRIPADMKVDMRDERGTKIILKKVAELLGLPNYVVDRQKEGFVQPSIVWMKPFWEERIRETLNDKSLKRHGLFTPSVVLEYVNRFFANPNDYQCGYKVWNLYCFQVWYTIALENGWINEAQLR